MGSFQSLRRGISKYSTHVFFISVQASYLQLLNLGVIGKKKEKHMEYICEVHLFRQEISGEKLVGHADLFKDGESYLIEFNNQSFEAEKVSSREFFIKVGGERIIARLEEEGINFLH